MSKKNGGAKRRRFDVIQDPKQWGGGVFRPFPVIGGLTWSDSCALAERAVVAVQAAPTWPWR